MRTPFRKSVLGGTLALVSALTFMLAACGTTSTSGPAAAPASQQVLNFPLVNGSSDVATLDPSLVQDAYSIIPIQMMFPGLIELNHSLSTVDYAATGVKVSNGGTTYTFSIRPGMKWSDGTAIDASTFAFSINRSLNPCLASPVAYYLYSIKDASAFNSETCNSTTGKITGSIQTLIGDSVVVQDPSTLVITLAQPAGYFLEAMSYPTSYAEPQALVTKYGNTWINHLTDNGAFGGGLFELASWDHAGHVDMVPNPNFWGSKPKLQKVDFTVYKDATTAWTDFLTKKQDLGFPPTADLAAAQKMPGYAQNGVLWIDYYAMNWHMAPFTNTGMRQAFDLALDKTVLATKILHGAVTATNHIVPQGMPGYDANLTGPFGAGVTGDLAKAQSLEQAYVATCPGAKAANCPKVTLTITTGSQDETNEAEAALAMWQQAFPGYPIAITTIDFNTLLSKLATHSVQFWSIAWIADYPDPQDWLSLQFSPTAQYNDGYVTDATANTLMTQADAIYQTTSSAVTQRMSLYNKAEQLLVSDVAWLPLDQETDHWVPQTYVVNFTQDAQGDPDIVDQWNQIYISTH